MKQHQEITGPYRNLRKDLKETCQAIVDEVQGFSSRALDEAVRRSLDDEKLHVAKELPFSDKSLSSNNCEEKSQVLSGEMTPLVSDAVNDKSKSNFDPNMVCEVTFAPNDENPVQAEVQSTNAEILIEPIDTLVLEIEKPQLEHREGEDFKSSSSGDKIVDGVENKDSDVKSDGGTSKDDWQVVNNDSDALVAQAAQMLGSALFQSNKNAESSDREEVDFHVNNTSVMSDLTCPPTTSDSSRPVHEISPMLLTRWKNELNELHSIGFVDDHANIEALGFLEAANMGVDSDDPISIEAVVNFLLNHSKGEGAEA